MLTLALALAGLALPEPAATKPAPPAPAAETAEAPPPVPDVLPDSDDAPARSAAAERVLAWVTATGDNRGHPYIVVDKPAAHAFLFAPDGTQLRDGPVLIGRTLGDEATPAIGRKSLAEIGPAEKTTPAGRYLARFGRAVGKPVLWVDYATSVALHTIPPANKEHRRARMASPTIADNRITFGCINVTDAFYQALRPRFRKDGGYVYVLPDEKPLATVFPLIALSRAPAAAEVATTPR